MAMERGRRKEHSILQIRIWFLICKTGNPRDREDHLRQTPGGIQLPFFHRFFGMGLNLINVISSIMLKRR